MLAVKENKTEKRKTKLEKACGYCSITIKVRLE